jgi:hypothetical protein
MLQLQVQGSIDVGVEEFILRSSHHPLVRSVKVASRFDMLNLLAILAECVEF